MKSIAPELVVSTAKLFRRDFLLENHLTFFEGHIHEDEYFAKFLWHAARRVVFVDEPLYFHVEREGSIMHTVNEARFLDAAGYTMELYQFIEREHPALLPFAWRRILNEVCALTMMARGTAMGEKTIRALSAEALARRPETLRGLGWKAVVKYWAIRLHLMRPLAVAMRLKGSY